MEIQRRQIFVGPFANSLWTSKSLIDFFQRLIENCSIEQCVFRPCVSDERKPDRSFAILTFQSAASVDRCLEKRSFIKSRQRLTVKRNLEALSRDQRPLSHQIFVSLKSSTKTNRSDLPLNSEKLLQYFGQYGSIDQWKILDDGQTFLLTFDDTDAVDRILLDKPHFYNDEKLSVNKCFQSNRSNENLSMRRIYELEDDLRHLEIFHQNELDQIQQKIQLSKETQTKLVENLKSLQQKRNDLKDKLLQAYRFQQQLKTQLEQTKRNEQQLNDDYQQQIEQQRRINQTLEHSISLTESSSH